LFTANVFAATVPSGFRDMLVAGGLSQPLACEFAPDGRLFILLKGGTVRIVKQGKLVATPALNLSVTSNSERGLLGLAFDPQFNTNHFIYLYYTTPSNDPKNRVSRFLVNGDLIDPASEKILVDGIRSDAGNHNAGCLQFGRDQKLYIAAGDGGANHELSQDVNSLNGKILRINKDGSIPSDNPFVGRAGARPEIWCYGLRNPWRFSFDSQKGTLFIGDVGQDTWEEVNIGQPGANFGWPEAEGNSSNPSFTNPMFEYNHNGQSAAITGGIVYHGETFPSDFNGAYFYGDYVRGFIRYLKLSTSNSVVSDNEFSPDAGSVVHITQGPDGGIYYVSIGAGQVRKIQFGSGTNRAPVAKIFASHRFGVLPLAVNFSAAGSSDPDGNPLTYHWQFGDGTTANGVQVTHSYTASNNFVAKVTATDSHGASSSAQVKIFAGDRAPVPQIIQPASAIFRVGQTVRFAGAATDPEDGVLDASRLTWTILTVSNGQTRLFLGPLNGIKNGSFHLPAIDPPGQSVRFRIRLKAVDSRGLSVFRFVDITEQR
jgi:glucose/arabinose dehydrogenase